ncbi:F-box/LRR-repeat protein At3g26922-like isoform X1 [Coffea arabica]|nr:F-box/LRR-repeat protein At3g26922-like [Coffea arabica]
MKKSSKSKQKFVNMNQDRISNLPDSILCKILSFLDLKESIQTIELSKRWIPLWTYLPDLNFDFDRYRFQSPSPVWQSQQILLPYTHFVNQVLSHRDNSSSIHKFRLAFGVSVNVDPSFVYNCVDYAINHQVQELDIAAYHYPKPFQFPQCLFTCRSLQKLRLKSYSQSMIIPKPFCLPTLKSLHLERFEFKDGEPFCFPKEPFSSFENLQELTLNCCIVDGLAISASKLKVLELLFYGSLPQFSSESKMGTISAPNLTSFKFEGQVSLVCAMEDLPCLETVYVDLYPLLERPYTDQIEEKMPMNLIKFLEQLKNAKYVTLSLSTVEVLAMESIALEDHPSPFHNMNRLKLITEPAWQYQSTVPPQNVMNYLTGASCFGDSLVVELGKA